MTRTPNRYDLESMKGKNISQELELDANRMKSQGINACNTDTVS